MEIFTVAALMAGTLILDEIDLRQIEAFCEINKLDYSVDPDKTKPEILNEVADLIDSGCSMSVKEYADTHNMTNAEVQEVTGKTHWNNRLGYLDLQKLAMSPAPDVSTEKAAPSPTETLTGGGDTVPPGPQTTSGAIASGDESVPTKKENEQQVNPRGFAARRAAGRKVQQEAKGNSGEKKGFRAQRGLK